jgi:uncharacterized protein (TIGR02266 family)
MSEWIQPSESERQEMARYEQIAHSARQSADIREHDRLSFQAEVTVKSETNFFMGFSENISEGGLFLATLSPPAIGESISIFVKTMEGEEIEVEGIVRWHRSGPGGLVTGCGVQFRELSPAAHRAFEAIMIQLRKEPLFFEV